MNGLNNYLTFEFLGLVVKIVLSAFALLYSIAVLRNTLDLQTFYESRFNIIFKVLCFLTVSGSLILLLTSFNR